MRGRVIGGIALAGVLLYGAGVGRLNPKIHLANGNVAHSWAIAESSGQKIVDVEASAGWLKLVLALGSMGVFAAMIGASEQLEDEEEMAMAQDRHRLALAGEKAELEKNFHLQKSAQKYQAQLDVHKVTAIIDAETQALSPVIPVQSQSVQQAMGNTFQQAANSAGHTQMMPTMPKTEFVTANTGSDRDIPSEFSANPKTALIVGVPGAGKGMFVANTIRQLRARRPELKVFGIDPKNDPKETGYWEEGYDKVWRTDNEAMTDEAFIAWLDRCIDQFKEEPGEKLLVFDEITLSFRRWGNTDKKSFDRYTNFKISVASSGDSRGVYIWEIGQVAHAADLNVSGGLRGISKPFAIVSNQDRRATDILLSTKFVPLPANGKSDVFAMCDKSPVGRAIYDYMSDSWQPMPKLKNYAGYDRDSRQFIGGAPQSNPEIDAPQTLSETVDSIKVKPTKEAVLALTRAGYGMSNVVATLWNTSPDKPNWQACVNECKALLD